MSNRFYEYDKGSSRSTRDDSRSRTHDDRSDRDRYGDKKTVRSRTRSRSPQRVSPEANRRRSPDRKHFLDVSTSKVKPHNSDSEDVPAPPPPPRISKISMDFTKPKVAPIKISLGSTSKMANAIASKPKPASVFGDDDEEEEPEEMPMEARMRMRNIGRETPTSAGPNSFGKTKQGFCNSKKLFEKNMNDALEGEREPRKLPQTIYKLKGP